VADFIGVVKIVHLADCPQRNGDQYCVICGHMLCAGSKTYVPGEDVFEERSTHNRSLARKEYIRCTELT
jgi:hypothetical protein